jgi:natural product biosynthesis luciferase-like monooxygenase protein/amino acid adenylation domain-containing protein
MNTRVILETLTPEKRAELAARLRRSGAPERRRAPIPKVAREEGRRYPVSFAQQRLWFLDQLEPGNPFYNEVFAASLTGDLHIPSVQRSLSEIVSRHEALRTTFSSTDGQPMQEIHPPYTVELQAQDLREIANPVQRAMELARAGARNPFDLSRLPLARASLYRISSDRYLFFLAMHHIVCDHWSAAVFVDEFATLYEAFSLGGASPLPPLPVQYVDFACWQRDYLNEDRTADLLRFWKSQLADVPFSLDIPLDYPRPAVRTYDGAWQSLQIDASLTEGIRVLARQGNATVFMVLLAAYAWVLARFSNQPVFAVGCAVAGRPREELKDLIGFFLNTLIICADASGGPSFQELLARLRNVCLGAYEHEDLPFEKLVEHLAPERGLNRTPVAQAMFTFQAATPHVKQRRGSIQPLPVGIGVVKSDFHLFTEDRGDAIYANLTYSTELYSSHTAARIMRCFEKALRLAVSDVRTLLTALPLLLDEGERRQMLEWSRGPVREEKGGCIQEMIAGQAAARGDACAVRDGERELSYRELDECANQLANYLCGMGVGPEVRVALCLERSVEMMVGILGVLKAGGVYVPLDPGYPVERLAWMLDDAQPAVIVTQNALAQALPSSWIQTITLDGDWAEIAGCSRRGPEVRISAENAAYLMYTSGSTGQPKAVVTAHRGVANLAREQSEKFGIEPGTRVLQFASVCFDASVSEWAVTLVAGGCLVLAGADEILAGESLAKTLERGGIESVTLPPSVLGGVEEWEYPRLRTLIVAGESCSAKQVEHWSRGRVMLNAYGPTECSVCASMSGAMSKGAVTIGKALGNGELYVLDDRLEPAPVGVMGEIYIGGAGLGRGYWKRAEVTAERFVPHPFSGMGGERLYRSGDLGRYLSNGEVEYVGRRDEQVKLRGYRIELGEIEGVLEEHVAVKQSVVVVREGSNGERRLVAYAAVSAGVEIGELREHLKRRLPGYMLPSGYMLMERLPLSENGKVDRRALPEEEQEERKGSKSRGPATAEEEIIAGIWKEVLGRERVGAEENFFELGGHSLLATQVASRIRKAFGVELELRTLFAEPTVAQLAERVGKAKGRVAPGIERRERPKRIPLSYAQERLWFLKQLEPESSMYNVPMVVRLRGEVDEEGLEAALRGVVERHEALRTRFEEVGGEAEQVIEAVWDEVLEREDATEEEVQGRIEEMAREPFDLRRGRLLRARLLRLGEAESVLAVVMHHIVTDGWSLGVLLEEVKELYQARRERREAKLAELPIQYADYALWQRQWMTGAELEDQLAYWRRQLEGTPLLELPADRRSGVGATGRGASEPIEFEAEASAALKQFAQREGVTVYMLLLTGFQVVLWRWTGQEDITVGADVANRNRSEVEGLIGFFVNQLALRTQVKGEESVRGLLARVRETALEGYAHQDAPFEKVVEATNPERSVESSPLFQVKLVLQNAQLGEVKLAGLEMEPVKVEGRQAPVDVRITLWECAGGLRGDLTYRAEKFERATMRRFVSQWQHVLGEMAGDASRKVCDLGLLEEGERRQMLEWSRGPVREEKGCCVQEMIAGQAAARGDACAVRDGERELSYRELDERANQLANYLCGMGVGPEVRVAVCLERSVEMMVGILGVLKAGGVYVPLDPGYPVERLAWMLDDTQPLVLISENSLLSGLPATAADVVLVDTDSEEIARRSRCAPGVKLSPANAAYIIYTSGSTGRPKGVVVTHGGLSHLPQAQVGAYLADQDTTVLQFASAAFDASVSEWSTALATGSTLVLRREMPPGGEQLVELLRSSSIGLAMLAPSVLATIEDSDLPDLKTLVVAGEPCPPALAQSWSPGRHMVNAYGPTECTVCASISDSMTGDCVTIGRPLANTRMYVLDGRLQPVPAGLAGELYIGGAGAARGYLGRPDLTAERFVPDPFTADEGLRLYRTGDIVRFLSSGEIEFIGRADYQIKIRGRRIEPAEIEARICEHPAVDQAVVVARELRAGEKVLVAYVVTNEPAAAAKLAEHAATLLPSFMVPCTFVNLPALPLTPSGKIDRAALPEPLDPDREKQMARTAIAEILAGIWGNALERERVGVDENFFDLGGHSLLITQVVARIRRDLGVVLPFRSLFDYPTISQLAPVIEDLLRQRAGLAALHPIERAARNGPIPLSYSQQWLWLVEQMQGGGSAYHCQQTVRLQGHLDEMALERALNEVVRRHEILRTSYPMRGEDVEPHVAPEFVLPIKRLDLATIETHDREARARQLIVEETERPFQFQNGPVVRAVLVRMGEQEHWLSLTIHHIATDAASLHIFADEFVRLYEANVNGLPSPLPELAIQYSDWAAWERETQSSEDAVRSMEFWRKALTGTPVLDLPVDWNGPANGRGATYNFELPVQAVESLRQLAREEGATVFICVLAAFHLLLSRYTGQTDFAIGSAVSERSHPDCAPLIGCFLNMLALRNDSAGVRTYRDLLRRIRETFLGAQAHRDTPFERIAKEIADARAGLRSPLFQAAMMWDRADDLSVKAGGLHISEVKIAPSDAKFDMALLIREQKHKIGAALEYSADRFQPQTIRRFADRLAALLEAVTVQPGAELSSIPIIRPPEREFVLNGVNQTSRSVPELCIHEWFENQVRSSPDAIALTCDDEQLKYCELDRRANELALGLVTETGSHAQGYVAVCVDRGPGLVVALLAVLKSGNAYVPLDPDYPRARNRLILEDSGASVLITSPHLQSDLPPFAGRVILVNDLGCLERPCRDFTAGHLLPSVSRFASAYVIYTSGSSGRPKGVVVTHANVSNFFVAMDEKVHDGRPGVWLAATSVCFDISVLELFWTLARGFHVVLLRGEPQSFGKADAATRRDALDFSLFYFAAEAGNGDKPYELLLDGARFADENGFAAVWSPERHFHPFGGIYPNPSVTGAAVAAITTRVAVRAGSVVLPLHQPARVAEEWAVVDQISNGRAGVSFASGWHVDDFVLAPDNYLRRKEIMLRDIDTVQKLWRGETIRLQNGAGAPVEVRIYPLPRQKKIPVWITAAGNPDTFRIAGETGANVLTHLLGQDVEELAERIALYRSARSQAGHMGPGIVTVMLHTFVGQDQDEVRAKVRQPFIEYLRNSLDLVKKFGQSMGIDADADGFTEKDMETLLEFACERYLRTSGLIGTPEQCVAMSERLRRAGVNELACLIDFGVDAISVKQSLEMLNAVRLAANRPLRRAFSLPSEIERNGVTHFQCTPSAAQLLLLGESSKLTSLRKLLVGGEAFPPSLADDLRKTCGAEVYNMYGPTETTIWSTVDRVDSSVGDVTIGEPVANTRTYVVDDWGEPLPIGMTGNLLISGLGVAGGYLGDPARTADRFRPDPFHPEPGARLYVTGDRACWSESGKLRFLGRADGQVKIRGFRIELGEIETVLGRCPNIRECAAAAETHAAGTRLVAFVAGSGVDVDELRARFRRELPEYMMPGRWVVLDRLPRLPNGKLDRRALAAIPIPQEEGFHVVEPRSDLESLLCQIWAESLRLERIGVNENFFELGGHSLMAARLVSRVRKLLEVELDLRVLFENPTVAGMAAHIEQAGERAALIMPLGEAAPAPFARSNASSL